MFKNWIKILLLRRKKISKRHILRVKKAFFKINALNLKSQT